MPSFKNYLFFIKSVTDMHISIVYINSLNNSFM